MQLGPKINNINKAGLVSMARTVNSIRNINFDVNQFHTVNAGNGINVSLANTNTSDSFPWDKLLFGYSITTNQFTVNAGEIHFKKTIYPVAQTTLSIGANNVYIYVEMEWGTGITSIKQSTAIADATASDSYYRKWLYKLNFTAPTTVSIQKIGHMGGAIDLMPIFG